MALMAAFVSAYAVSSARLASGKMRIASCKKFHAVHMRHALIRQQQRHAVIANLQLLQKIQRALRRIAAITRYSAP